MNTSLMHNSPIFRELQDSPLAVILKRYPFAAEHLESLGFSFDFSSVLTLEQELRCIDSLERDERGLCIEEVLKKTALFIEQMLNFLGLQRETRLETVSLYPGFDKNGNPEGFDVLTFRPSELISIVGPTGSGKSRLLADIEWMAQGDTPSGRRVMINDREPDRRFRFSAGEKLVAQLSQNMNFVMDLSVGEFLRIHAESRFVERQQQHVEAVVLKANELAGEPFSPEIAVTSLSGGQSRALMIADTAMLSGSPIVLIDEIENAGIDRRKALDLLLSKEKIVLMATHDPLLALTADRRLVIGNGGIREIIGTSSEERAILRRLEALDRSLQRLRGELRRGKRISRFEM
ncbi:ATP-binding cassette domain-containing protein [Sediminispirochaeta bajacaliforniensis]|uniref:ATP-binding cassette domain-containing protein n=1 Tax=Sediminispirochaeta bajacaliforniensis TaxID=148 RepID=UPI00035FCF33|nr:ATP-binding cassette domain-containing protein [Sediminispirochaeta bajacaliforniensis]